MKKLALSLALLSSAPVFAGTITLDFETAPSFASVGNTYASAGVTFGQDLQGLTNDALGPYFSNAPSPVGVIFVSGGGDATMNVAGGFYAISFFYSSADVVADALQVWSDVGGTGTLLKSFSLESNATLGCTDTAYCNWSRLSADLNGTGRSVTFSSGAQLAAFDDITLVPEPSSVLLAGLAMTALLVTRRRA